ncbi:MAG: GNAT family N-acetyltransferase [Pseudomonadales bacterium]
MPASNLKLEPINNLNWRKTLGVRTTPGQLEFVADFEPVALVILSKSYVRAGSVDWHPFMITMAGATVGVVALTHHETRCEIFHLVVDRNRQGQGLGKASVVLLVDHVRETWPEVDSLELTVHPNNEVARHMYASCGFVSTGEFKDSEPVMAMTL